MEQPSHLFCLKCGLELTGGKGNFYVIRIEAVADPTPPSFSDDDLAGTDTGEQIDALLEQMRHMSQRELMDQVYRRMTIHLCGSCYRRWIEHPAGD